MPATQNRTRNGTPCARRPPRWGRAFLAALSITLDVRHSAKLARISRSEVYARRATDPVFAAAWADAMAEAFDRLHWEAYRRAVEGVPVPRTYRGKPVMVWQTPDGEVVPAGTPGAVCAPLVERRYSTKLLLVLLQLAKPEEFGCPWASRRRRR